MYELAMRAEWTLYEHPDGLAHPDNLHHAAQLSSAAHIAFHGFEHESNADSVLHQAALDLQQILFVDPTEPEDLRAASRACRVRDHQHLVIECDTCDDRTIRRINVVKDNNPNCHTCIRQKRVAAAQIFGARLVGRDRSKGRHDFIYELACGHYVSRKVGNFKRAIEADFNVGCDACREDRYRSEARRINWQLVGPTSPERLNYRRYRHECGHEQDITVRNMMNEDCDCAGCGQSWASKRSYIYIFEIDLPNLRVLKLGYSSTPEIRLRQQLGISRKVGRNVRRKVPIVSGNIAVSLEKLCHHALARVCPEFIVPKAVFANGINTGSEIYYRSALPVLDGLIEAIEAGIRPDDALVTSLLKRVRKTP